jgi:hypothetical protein
MSAGIFAFLLAVVLLPLAAASVIRNMRLARRMAAYRGRSRRGWGIAALLDGPVAVLLLSALRRRPIAGTRPKV